MTLYQNRLSHGIMTQLVNDTNLLQQRINLTTKTTTECDL